MNQKQAKKAVKKLSIDKKDPKVESTQNKNKSAEAMQRAWQIAREGAAKFGGSANQYIGEAMKIAWKVLKDDIRDGQPRIEEIYLNRLKATLTDYINYEGDSASNSSISGYAKEQRSAERLLDLLEDAIEKNGVVGTYNKIKANFDLGKFEKLVDDLAWAVYNGKEFNAGYAVWGSGGATKYESDIAEIYSALGVDNPYRF